MDQENSNPDENLESDPEPQDQQIEVEPDANGSLARVDLPDGYSRRGLDEMARLEKSDTPRDKESDLMEHLGELRSRILYSITFVCIAMVATWNFGDRISDWFSQPIRTALKSHNIHYQLITIGPSEGLMIYFQIITAAALIISMPFIFWQFWRFVEPALSHRERRFTVILVPFSVVLFFVGCALGYYMSPLFFNFFLAFQPPGSVANFSYGQSVALLAKMLLVFGICFQVPVIVIFLHKIGVVSQDVLVRYWRHVIVAIFIIVAILTPTWDPLTLTVCAVPPCLLYFVAIWMIRWL
jgi:sec-independent protein translocase protein TatC